MSEQQLNRNISSEQDKLLNDEMEIDLMDVLRKIISIRKTLYKAAGVGDHWHHSLFKHSQTIYGECYSFP